MITKSPQVRKHHEYLIFYSKFEYTFLQLVSSGLRSQEIRLSSTYLLQPTGIRKQTIFSPETPSLVFSSGRPYHAGTEQLQQGMDCTFLSLR